MKHDVHKVFELFLKDSGQRYTEQRRESVTQIYKIRTHFEVEDFIGQLRKKKISFSRATVYRTIKQLLEAGLIQKITTKDGRVFYERGGDHQQHDHLICNQCGKLFEIQDSSIDEILTMYAERLGFVSQYRSLHVYGVCKFCQKSSE